MRSARSAGPLHGSVRSLLSADGERDRLIFGFFDMISQVLVRQNFSRFKPNL
jgi:hypothetical protein